MTRERRGGRGNRGTLTDFSAVMPVYRLLSCAMHSRGDRDWPAHPLMLSLHDFRGLVVCDDHLPPFHVGDQHFGYSHSTFWTTTTTTTSGLDATGRRVACVGCVLLASLTVCYFVKCTLAIRDEEDRIRKTIRQLQKNGLTDKCRTLAKSIVSSRRTVARLEKTKFNIEVLDRELERIRSKRKQEHPTNCETKAADVLAIF